MLFWVILIDAVSMISVGWWVSSQSAPSVFFMDCAMVIRWKMFPFNISSKVPGNLGRETAIFLPKNKSSVFVWAASSEWEQKRATWGPRVCRFSFQPKTAAGHFTDWHPINRRGKMNHLVHFLLRLKTGRLLGLRGRWLFSLQNKVDFWTRGQFRTDWGICL